MESSEASGIIILLIGIALLVTTFIDAYLFLGKDVTIMPIYGLMEAFSEALAPLIESCIQMIYLGLMGWIGSTLTMRGITVLSQVKPKIPERIKTKAEPEDLHEAWERALQETKMELNRGGKTTGV